MALRDLLVRFGIQVEGQDHLDSADKKLRQAKNSAQNFGASLQRIARYLIVGAVVRGVKNFIAGQLEQADALEHNAQRLGVTTEELQKYEYASNLMGVSVLQTVTGLRYFNRAVGEAALGTKAGVKTFALLGINIRDANGDVRPTSDLLFEFADTLKGVKSQAERTAFAMRVFGRQGAALLPVLQNGSAELRELMKDVDELGGGFNDKFIEQAHITDVLLKKLRLGWRSVYVALMTEILPAVQKWLRHSIQNVKELIDLAKKTYAFRTALIFLVGTLGILFALFATKLPVIGDLLRFAFNHPILTAFIASLGALYVIFDDIYTFLQGGDSILGRFLEKLGGTGTALQFWKDLTSALKELWEALKPVQGSFTEISRQIGEAFAKSIPSMIRWGSVFATYVIQTVDAAISGVRELGTILGGIWESARQHSFKPLQDALGAAAKGNEEFEKRGSTYSRLRATFNEIGNPAAIGRAPQFTQGAPENPINVNDLPRAPSSIHVEVTQHITGTSDPKATGDAAAKGVGRAVKTAASRDRDTWNAVNMGQPVTGN